MVELRWKAYYPVGGSQAEQKTTIGSGWIEEHVQIKQEDTQHGIRMGNITELYWNLTTMNKLIVGARSN